MAAVPGCSRRATTVAVPAITTVSGFLLVATSQGLNLIFSIAMTKSDKLKPNVLAGAPPARSVEDAVTRKTPRQLKRRLGNLVRPKKGSTHVYRALRISVRSIVTYTYTVLELFPKRHKERFGLGMDIVTVANRCLELAIEIEQYNPAMDRISKLRELSVKLKMLEELVEVSHACYTINEKKRNSWMQMITNADNVVVGLAMGLEKGRKKDDEKSKNSLKGQD
jgi:hypothetical protein